MFNSHMTSSLSCYKIALLVFILSCTAVASGDSVSDFQCDDYEVWPKGTQLFIPDRVMESYQKEKDSWSDPFVYLLAQYFVSGPSMKDKRMDAMYIPLVRKQTENREQREAMVDVFSIIRRTSHNGGIFLLEDICVPIQREEEGSFGSN